MLDVSVGLSAVFVGGSIGARYEPGRGFQFYTSASAGPSVGASIRGSYDRSGKLIDRNRGEGPRIQAQAGGALGIGISKNKTANFNPSNPFDFSSNTQKSTSLLFGLELGADYSF